MIPHQWKLSKIILIPKKGNQNNISNFRPISIISILYKIFAKIIQKRIKPTIETFQTCDQAGFRKSFATTDHILVLRELMQKATDYKFEIYLGFIDFKKAFDTVSHDYMLEALARAGLEKGYISIIKEIYNNAEALVMLETLGDKFPLQRGVKQGDPLSPDLFNCTIQNVFNERKISKGGINIAGKTLDNLRFADDVVLVESSADKLEEAMNEIAIKAREAGLEINQGKTHILTNGPKKQIKLENEVLNYEDEVTYLGQILSFDDMMNKELRRRSDLAWKSYWKLKHIFKNNFSLDIKIQMWEKCILPIITYGCQTWTLSKKNKKFLEVLQRRFLRSILNIKLKDKITNEEIMLKTKARSILEVVGRLKWGWGGHVMRMTDGRWTRAVVEWFPRDRARKRGNPGIKWESEFYKYAGNTWPQVARQRRAWANAGKLFNL